MVTFSYDLQLGFGGGPFDPEAFEGSAFEGGGGWESVLDARRTESIILEYGIEWNSPTDLIDSTGFMRWAFDNSDRNVAKILGWYSPLNVLRRSGLAINIPARLVLTEGGNPPYYKFVGSLGNILPTPGRFGDRLVPCEAVNIMDDYARMPMPALPVQLNKRSDEVIQSILDELTIQPVEVDLETGIGTFPISLDQAPMDKIKVREAFNQYCLSEFATLSVVGSYDGGGKLQFRNRRHPALNPDVLFMIDNDHLEMQQKGSREDLYSKVIVTILPTKVDPAPNVVLWELETTSIVVQAGETNSSIFGPYRDPANPDVRISGVNMQAPVITTDYLMNSAQDGSGTNLSANFTVTPDFSSGSGVAFPVIRNNGTQAAFITKLRALGQGVYRREVVVTRDVDTVYGVKDLQVIMPYQNDINVGMDIAAYYGNILSQPLARVPSVTFLANDTAEKMHAAVTLEPGDRIAIIEEVTGLTGEQFLINRVRLEITPEAALLCTWELQPVSSTQSWIWGIAEMGISTIFGF